MDTSKAIFLGLVFLALAIILDDSPKPASAGLESNGQYMAATPERNGYIFIVNTQTAAIKTCWLKTMEGEIKCGKWHQ